MHTLESRLRRLRRHNRRPAPKPAAILGGKHPSKVREFNLLRRVVFLADGAALPLDQWMAAA